MERGELKDNNVGLTQRDRKGVKGANYVFVTTLYQQSVLEWIGEMSVTTWHRKAGLVSFIEQSFFMRTAKESKSYGVLQNKQQVPLVQTLDSVMHCEESRITARTWNVSNHLYALVLEFSSVLVE